MSPATDRKRSAFEAGRSTGSYGNSSSSYSSYSYRAGYGAGYGSSHYNTDWAKSYYQHQQTRNARLSESVGVWTAHGVLEHLMSQTQACEAMRRQWNKTAFATV